MTAVDATELSESEGLGNVVEFFAASGLAEEDCRALGRVLLGISEVPCEAARPADSYGLLFRRYVVRNEHLSVWHAVKAAIAPGLALSLASLSVGMVAAFVTTVAEISVAAYRHGAKLTTSEVHLLQCLRAAGVPMTAAPLASELNRRQLWQEGDREWTADDVVQALRRLTQVRTTSGFEPFAASNDRDEWVALV